MSNYTRATQGKPLAIPAAAYNGFCNVAEEFERNGYQTGQRSSIGVGVREANRIVVRVKNNTGAQIAFGACVMFDESPTYLSVFSGDRYETNSNPTLSAVFRSATATTMFPQRSGVALEPIPNGEFGRVCIRGVCVALSGATSGWLMPTFTSSASSFTATTKRTNAQVLCATSDGYSIVYLDEAPWQTRRSNAAADANVTSISRGTSFGSSATEDGFRDTHTVSLSSGGTWEEVIEPSIIRVPCAGVYDFRYTLYAELNLNGGVDGGPMSGVFGFYMRNIRVQAKIALVNASTGAYISGVNWPSSDGNGGGLINAPFAVETGGGIAVAYAGRHRGNITIESRFSLSTGISLCVGLVLHVAASSTVGVPSMTLSTQGTGIIRPAEQDIYLDPPP